MNINEAVNKSLKIRELYHELEIKHHETKWSIKEDALAFLTDAGLVGRQIMSLQKRWPSENEEILGEKIGECIWWLMILAERSGLDAEKCLEDFLNQKIEKMDK